MDVAVPHQLPRTDAPCRVRRTALFPVLLALALLAAGCELRPLLPVLLGSDPAAGATVARSAWLVLRFASSIPAGAESRGLLMCNGLILPRHNHVAAPDTLVVNPDAWLPAGALCRLSFQTVAGRVDIGFRTASAGAPFPTVYDRRDRNRPLPFPDDFFLVSDPSTPTGLRPDVLVPDHSLGVKGLLNAMSLVAARADGWSPIGNLAVEISGAPDPATLPLTQEESLDPLASVGLFDLDPGSAAYGERVPFKLTIRSDAIGSQPPSHSLVIFPGIPLRPMGRYGLVVTDRVLSEAGEPLTRSAFFEQVIGPPVGGEEPEVARARPLALEVVDALEALASLPIPREDVAVAVRLSVRSIDHFSDDVLAMREDVVASPASHAITSVEARTGDVAAIVHGSFEAPSWLAGPFLQRDAGGRPQMTGTSTLPFILALPRAAETVGHAPIVMYQHGNPGSAEGEVPGAAGGFLAAEGFAVAGFTDLLNRTYADVEEQQLAIFTIVLFTGNAPDYYVHTYAEQIAFLHLLQSLGALDVLPVGAPDGVPDLDPGAIVYEGISYGSVHGQAFLAYAPEILAGGLVVGASRLTELLEYQDRTRPMGGPSFLTEVLPGYIAGMTPPDLWMGLGLFSIVYDQQDPHNHASFLYRNPVVVGGSTRKPSILVLEGIADSFTKNNTTRSLAWLLGPIPHLAEAEVVPVSYLPVAAGPIQGNVDAETTAAFVQFAPAGLAGIPPSPGCTSQSEGHYCAQTAPEARGLRAGFYRSAVLESAPIAELP